MSLANWFVNKTKQKMGGNVIVVLTHLFGCNCNWVSLKCMCYYAGYLRGRHRTGSRERDFAVIGLHLLPFNM